MSKSDQPVLDVQVILSEEIGKEIYTLSSVTNTELQRVKYSVVRVWTYNREERLYRDYPLATHEFYRQTEEAIGYDRALEPEWKPSNDHQFNGASLRHAHEEESRFISSEVDF